MSSGQVQIIFEKDQRIGYCRLFIAWSYNIYIDTQHTLIVNPEKIEKYRTINDAKLRFLFLGGGD